MFTNFQWGTVYELGGGAYKIKYSFYTVEGERDAVHLRTGLTPYARRIHCRTLSLTNLHH